MQAKDARSGDPVTIDQLRVLIAVVEEGSFSSAAKRLLRAQSAVSYAIGNLERLLDVRLFDRSGSRPQLSPEGKALVAEARAATRQMDHFLSRAGALHAGLEARIDLAVDPMYPLDQLTTLLTDFHAVYPGVDLKLRSESLGGVLELVAEGECSLGIGERLENPPDQLRLQALPAIEIAMMVAPSHPLARCEGPVAKEELSRHLQLVISDRSPLTAELELGVYSQRTWRLGDFATKKALMIAGFGFGSLPLHLAQDALSAGQLQTLQPEDWRSTHDEIKMVAVTLAEHQPGPATQWLLARLTQTTDPGPQSPET